MSAKSSWFTWGKVKNKIDAIDAAQVSISDGGTIVTDVITGVPKIATPTSSATANTFGSWAAYDASASAISYICGITVGVPARGASIDAQIDVGVTEAAIISVPFNYFYKSDVGYLPTVTMSFPIPIEVAAAGAISLRVTDSEANANAYRVGLIYYTGL